jgi:hypothetical protein
MLWPRSPPENLEIDTMLARLQTLSDDHFGCAPDHVTWGLVGTLEHYAELLKRITDSAFKVGTPRSAPDLPPRPDRACPAGLGLVRRATVLSGNGDHPMTKLSDTQAVILSAASQRDDGAVLPFPETLRIKGGAVAKVLGSLKTKGLIDHQGTPRGDNPPPLRITRAGLQAIGVETEGDPSEGATPAKRKARASAKPGKAAAGQKPTPRAGTKQALMIDLLKRAEGATVEQIAAATGVPYHPRRHLGRAQEEARPHGRGHPHPRGRPQQDRRQGQRDHLPDRRVARPITCQHPAPPRPRARRRSLRSSAHLRPGLRRRHCTIASAG